MRPGETARPRTALRSRLVDRLDQASACNLQLIHILVAEPRGKGIETSSADRGVVASATFQDSRLCRAFTTSSVTVRWRQHLRQIGALCDALRFLARGRAGALAMAAPGSLRWPGVAACSPQPAMPPSAMPRNASALGAPTHGAAAARVGGPASPVLPSPTAVPFARPRPARRGPVGAHQRTCQR